MASFPESVHSFATRHDGFPVPRSAAIAGEAHSVPNSAPHSFYLHEAPDLLKSFVIEEDGGSTIFRKVATGAILAPGDFTCDQYGLMLFHPDDAGRELLIYYTATGTVAAARHLNEIQDEVEAVETFLTNYAATRPVSIFRSFRIPGQAVVPSPATRAAHVFVFSSARYSSVRAVAVNMVAPQDMQYGLSGVTQIQFSKSATFASGNITVSIDGSSYLDSEEITPTVINVSAGEKLYCRVLATGGHAELHVEVEFEVVEAV